MNFGQCLISWSVTSKLTWWAFDTSTCSPFIIKPHESTSMVNLFVRHEAQWAACFLTQATDPSLRDLVQRCVLHLYCPSGILILTYVQSSWDICQGPDSEFLALPTFLSNNVELNGYNVNTLPLCWLSASSHEFLDLMEIAKCLFCWSTLVSVGIFLPSGKPVLYEHSRISIPIEPDFHQAIPWFHLIPLNPWHLELSHA